jgi:arylformamidase
VIKKEHCQKPIELGAKRILFKTLTFPDPEVFHEEFAFFAPEAIELMGQTGVILVGLDTPSVDPFSSKDLPSHNMLMRYQIRNLEGLDLKDVSQGFFELIALPLKLAGMDGSPVRAILRPLNDVPTQH